MSAIPTRVREAVKFRDFGRCVFCSAATASDIHHRMRRREGGHALSVCITLCRTCHEKAHANPQWARERGIIVPTWREPTGVPLKSWRGWCLLDDKGGIEWLREDKALAIMQHQIPAGIEQAEEK